MTEPVYIKKEKLETFVQKVLTRLNVSPDHGKITAERLVMAHLRGFDTHGLPCLPGYVECLEQDRMNPAPSLEVTSKFPWANQVDADNGLGQVAGTKAMKLCLEAADNFGIGCSVVKRSNHFGAASAYSLMALEKDCIGIVTSNASKVTAPFGAAEPLLGTNPLSVAVPAGKNAPFVIDMATSEGARKKVKKALELGEPIPPGWSLDENGDPTTDPAAALKGVMLPFGGMKGSAIAILTDILAGVFTGANFGGDVLSVFSNQERESGNGNFMLAIKIDTFMPADEFKARMDDELNRIRALAPAGQFKQVIYPGYLENETQARRMEQGIPFDSTLVEKMCKLGDTVSVPFLR